MTGKDYPTEYPTIEAINVLLSTLVSRSEVLWRACLVSGRWGTPEANRAVAHAIRSLGFHPVSGYTYWIELRDFCASLCFYWALAGAIARDDFATAHSFMHARIKRSNEGLPADHDLLQAGLLGGTQESATKLIGAILKFLQENPWVHY